MRRPALPSFTTARMFGAIGAIGAVAVSVALLGAAPARAQLAPDAVGRFGGRWAADCADRASSQVRVERDALVVQRQGRRLTATAPQTLYSFFGNSPAPEGFLVALLAEPGGGAETLTAMVYQGRSGQYLELEADEAVQTRLGHGIARVRFWRCDGTTRAAVPATRPAPPSPAASLEAGSPEAMVSGRAMTAAWRAALGARERALWLLKREGPATPARWVDVDGRRMVMHAFCQPHDCHDNSAVALFDPGTGQALGLVQRQNQFTLVGHPNAAQAARLRALWRGEWRK